MSTKSMVRSIVKELVRNIETLSENKWASVHKVKDPMNPSKEIYRVHCGHVFGNALIEMIDAKELSVMIWDLPRVTFDSASLWFTIEAKR